MSVVSMNVAGLDFYQCLLDNLDDAVFFVDCEGTVIHWNRAAEELTGRMVEDVVGGSCSQSSLRHINSDGTCQESEASPAARVLADGRRREADMFLRHRQGHLVPAHIRALPLHDIEGQLAGVVEILSDNSAAIAAEAEIETLRQNSLLDPLTETASRRHVEMRLEARLEEAKRYGWPFGVVAAAVDNFEVIRNAHSSKTTDRLIRMAAKTFASTLRNYDVMGRWGEGDFLSVVPVKGPQDLAAIGERVRSLVEEAQVKVDERVLGVTLSIGVVLAEKDDTVESLVNRAHQELRKSLDEGGNRVC